MKDIKVKETSNKTIKTINRVNLWSERIKDSVMCLNQKSKDSVSNDTSIVDYGSEQVSLISNRMKNESIHILKKSSVKLNNKVIKNSNKSIKTINRSIKDTSKAAKNPIKVSKKTFEQGRKLAIETAKQTTKTVKLLFKVTVSTIKSIIATLKSLVSIISAGGIVSIIIIVITALVSLIFTSCFGIFFSNEGSSISMSSVISETNVDLYNEIERQKALHTCDDYEIVYDSNNWREVIAIYSVKYSASESPETILYLNEDNISKIKKVFWDMNIITTKTIYEEKESETLSEGSYVTTLQPKNILYITINNKSKEELMSEYLFTEDQENQVNELLDQKYNLL